MLIKPMIKTTVSLVIVCSILTFPQPSQSLVPKEIIQNKGSDSMAIAVQAWSEIYHRIHPDTAVTVNGGGSGTGIAALINGTVDIANASRNITEKEITNAKQQNRDPVKHIVAFDALAFVMHLNNPLRSLTYQQIAEIFGEGGTFEHWTDIGITVPGCSDQKIIRVSRQNSSGTYAYLRNTIFTKKQEYKMGTYSMQASKDVVSLVEKTPCAIGYTSLVYNTPQVNVICVGKTTNAPCVLPNIQTIKNRTYPLTRPLLMYTDGQPRDTIKLYLDWVVSDVGQCIALTKGYGAIREVACNLESAALFYP